MPGSKIIMLSNAEKSLEGIEALFSAADTICIQEPSYGNYLQMISGHETIPVLAIHLPMHTDALPAILEHFKVNYKDGIVIYFSLSDVRKEAGIKCEGYIQHHHWKISATELQLIRHVAAGKRASEMADIMCLSVRTIETYIRNLLQKLDVHNRPQLIHFAHINGLL